MEKPQSQQQEPRASSWPLGVHLWGKTIDCCEVGTLSCRKLNKCLSSVCCLQEWCATFRLLNRNCTKLAMKWGKVFVCTQSHIGLLFCVLHSTSCTRVVVPYLRSWLYYSRNLNTICGNKLAIDCEFCKEIISAPPWDGLTFSRVVIMWERPWIVVR